MSPFDSHRGHLELAWQCLKDDPFEVGAPRFIARLKAHVEEKGVAAKYHATITWAFLSLIAERIAQSPGVSCDAFLERYPELFDPGLVKQHYPNGELDSALARATFMLPARPTSTAGASTPTARARGESPPRSPRSSPQ